MNKNDIYNDQFKALFKDFEAEVPSDGWDRLEKSLGASKRATIVRRNWYIGSAAAVAVILITGILFINNPKQIDNFTPQLTDANTETVKPQNNTSVQEQNQQNVADANTSKTLIAKHTPSKPELIGEESIFVIDDSDVEIPNQPYFPPSSKTSKEEATSDNKKDKQLTQEEIDTRIKELQEANNTNLFDESEIAGKNKNPLMLAINAKGGLTSSQIKSNSPMRLRSASAQNMGISDDIYLSAESKNNLTEDGKNNTGSVADNIAEMTHSQPYSVGVTVSKSITDRLSIETGLVYTYLYSESKNVSTNYENKENQELHYLGIPLNLNYNFVQLGKFNLFASVGAMIEKDINGIYRGVDYGKNDALDSSSYGTISRSIKLKNPQFSINTGIGASYALYGGFNIYAKVGGAYYFDANNIDYKTIYSDKKILLDLNAGIRFQF